jgi:hypothetical protein
MLDVAAYNAVALYKTKVKSRMAQDGNLDEFRFRKSCLESLSKSFINPCIEQRNLNASRNNYACLHSNLLESFRRVGQEIVFRMVSQSKSKTISSLPRCHVSACETRKKGSKVSNKCENCNNYFCLNHVTKSILCNDCLKN